MEARSAMDECFVAKSYVAIDSANFFYLHYLMIIWLDQQFVRAKEFEENLAFFWEYIMDLWIKTCNIFIYNYEIILWNCGLGVY